MKFTLILIITSLLASHVCCTPLAVFYYLQVGNKVMFRADLSIGAIKQYTWDFGDGTDSVTTNDFVMTYYYPTSSLWKVKLTVTDTSNRQGSVQNLVLSPFNNIPTCNFAVSSINGDRISLDASKSKDLDGVIALYSWDMNDGSSMISTNSSSFTYTYLQGGYYLILLTVQDNSRANSTVCSKRVFVNQAPVASFTSIIKDHEVIFDASSSHDMDGSIFSYKWFYGDNQTSNTSLDVKISSHSFLLSGWYNITLNVTDNLGNSTLLTQRILIDIPPKPKFQVILNHEDDLILNASETWTDNNSHIVNLIWDWNDSSALNETSNQNQEVKHTYALGAYYDISVLVTDNYGKQGRYDKVILVNSIPKVYFEASEIMNDTIFLRSDSVDLDGFLTQIYWDFGDGTNMTLEGASKEIEHTFKWGGDYKICLTIQDNLDFQNTSCNNFFLNRVPTASFKIIENVNDTLTIGDNHSEDLDGQIIDFSWNWGDGTSESNTSFTSHNYTWGGYYNISLTVTDNLGGKDTQTQIVRVNAPPISKFTIIKIVNDTITLETSQSLDIDGEITSYSWSFGDGKTLIVTNSSLISHKYRFGGNYIITLIVTDNMNDTSNYSENVFVDIPPFADFEIISGFENGLVIVSAKPYLSKENNSYDRDGQLTSLIWNFGDNTGNITNTTHTTQLHQYTLGGNYTISLFAQDNNDVYSQKVEKYFYINAPPTASIALTENEHGLLTLEGSNSYDHDGSIALYCWNFGDSPIVDCSPNSTVQYLYSRSGNYTISLKVVDNLGVESQKTDMLFLTVNQPPFTAFLISDALPSGVLTFEANNDLSFDLDGLIVKYQWSFGDNTSVTTLNTDFSNFSKVTHQYQKSGFYNITLQVFDDFGATSNLTLEGLATVQNNYLAGSMDPTSEDFLKQTDQQMDSFTPNQSPIPNIQLWVQDSQTVSLSAQASKDPDGSIVSYFWDLGNSTYSNEVTLTHRYYQGGPVNVSLTVVDNQGAKVSTFRVIHLNYLPTAIFTFKQISELTINFDGSRSFDVENTKLTYLWNFGNGKQLLSSTKSVLNYTYTTPDIYTVTLTVTDIDGAQNSFSQNINLRQSAISAVRVNNGLPRFALIQHAKSAQYLAFTFDPTLASANYTTQSDEYVVQNNSRSTTPYFMLSRNLFTGGYYIMNQENGLALTLDSTMQMLKVGKQNKESTAFLIYSYGAFYQIRDPLTENFLVLTETNELIFSQNPTNNDHLWSLIASYNQAYGVLPLN